MNTSTIMKQSVNAKTAVPSHPQNRLSNHAGEYVDSKTPSEGTYPAIGLAIVVLVPLAVYWGLAKFLF